MEIKIPQELYKPLKKVIRLQNIQLLKIIATEEGWNYKELKGKYIKDTEISELIKKYDKKEQKKKTKKSLVQVDEIKDEAGELDTNTSNTNVEEPNKVKNVEEPNKVKKIKKIKKARKHKKISIKIENDEVKEIKCKEFQYEGIDLLYDIDNMNVYTMELEFVGRKIDNFINRFTQF